MVAPVTLVLGGEDLLIDRAVADVIAALRADEPGAVVHDLTPDRLEPGVLIGLAAPSLFGDRALVVLRRGQEITADRSAEVVSLLADPGDAVVVVTHTGVANRGKAVLDAAKSAADVHVVEVKAPTRPSDKKDWLRSDVRRLGRVLTDDGAQMLMDAVGSDLRELANAAAQLVADTEGAIDAQVVSRYYDGRAEVTSFKVADAAVEGRVADALEQLRFALACGVAPVLVTSAIAGSLRSLVRLGGAPRGMREADLARDLRVPPWKIRVLRQQLNGWTGDGLAVAIGAVAQADEAVKGGVVREAETWALEHAVLTVARARRGR